MEVLSDRAAEALQSIVADLDYPMAIVTTTDGTERAGCLVGFAAQCSIDPRSSWCRCRSATTPRRWLRKRLLHFPSCAVWDLAALFGEQTGDEVDKFGRCSWKPGPRGLPRLSGCSRWIAGAIVERVDTGDHVGHLLEPFDAATDDWSGQLGFQAVQDLEPGHRA